MCGINVQLWVLPDIGCSLIFILHVKGCIRPQLSPSV
jgi:hypothetical protein